MTAVRVITDHNELSGSGVVSHDHIDVHITTTPFIVVSGTVGNVPSSARKLKAGPGIIITDDGPGDDLVVQVDPAFLSGSLATRIWNEAPSGSINGVNTIFTLAYAPNPSHHLQLFLNGVLQEEGATNDFVLSGSQITFTYPPSAMKGNAKLRATYEK